MKAICFPSVSSLSSCNGLASASKTNHTRQHVLYCGSRIHVAHLQQMAYTLHLPGPGHVEHAFSSPDEKLRPSTRFVLWIARAHSTSQTEKHVYTHEKIITRLSLRTFPGVQKSHIENCDI